MNYIGREPAPDGLILVGDTNPIGAINYFHAVPDGSWLALNGQIVMKAAYPDLWALAQGFLTADQAVNPGLYRNVDANTFALPKLDGLFIRSVGGIAPNAAAALGVKQADELLSHTHRPNGAATPVAAGIFSAFTNNSGGTIGEPTSPAGGPETRPVNVALMPCVKALRTVLMPATLTVAGQADMEAAASASKIVTPAVQKYHPGMAKGWAKYDSAANIAAAYNVASVTDNAVGQLTVNWIVPFSSGNYAVSYTGQAGSPMFYGIDNAVPPAPGSVKLDSWNAASGLADQVQNYVAAFGDQ